MAELSATALASACSDDGRDAGIRIRTELEPLAGLGGLVKPAVYAGGVFQEDRRWHGADAERRQVDVVVLDNVPSQANRLEAALLERREALGLPEIVLDLTAAGSLPPHLPTKLSSFQFPHRQADAYLRDAVLDGEPFERTEEGKRLFAATRWDAEPLLKWFPQALLFGFWQSHLGKKRSQAKLARSWVSEIIGVEPATRDDDRTRTLGLKGDPVNLSTDEKVVFDAADVSGWVTSDEKKGGSKGEKLSEIGHGQVPFKGGEEALSGVSFASIEQASSVSFAGLRQLGVGDPEQVALGRALVAALGLVAHSAAFGRAFTLRSGCALRPVSDHWEWIGATDVSDLEAPSLEASIELFRDCVTAAEKVGLPVGSAWPDPLLVAPNDALIRVIQKTWPVGD